MKTILINGTIYVLDSNIRSISKYVVGKKDYGTKDYQIVLEYNDGQKNWEHFVEKETRDAAFDEIYKIMKEIK